MQKHLTHMKKGRALVKNRVVIGGVHVRQKDHVMGSGLGICTQFEKILDLEVCPPSPMQSQPVGMAKMVVGVTGKPNVDAMKGSKEFGHECVCAMGRVRFGVQVQFQVKFHHHQNMAMVNGDAGRANAVGAGNLCSGEAVPDHGLGNAHRKYAVVVMHGGVLVKQNHLEMGAQSSHQLQTNWELNELLPEFEIVLDLHLRAAKNRNQRPKH